jgi:prepilin-type processing-associated H-X9-DG protein
MALYLPDNYDRYPTNRVLGGGTVTYSVPLSVDGVDPTQGKQGQFQYGVNWVEALYPYLQRISARTSTDWKSFRACPNASLARLGGAAANPYMTYVFNYYMVELQSSLVRSPESLMMLREMDRHVAAICRPTNKPADPGIGQVPLNSFLTAYDGVVGGTTNPNLHGTGSYIAFADGHVHYFTTDYFPTRPVYPAWDSATSRWYNFVYANPSTDQERKVNKTIAISP